MAKNRGKHTSAGRDLKRPVNKLERQDGVKKVVLGPYISKSCRSGHRYSAGTLRFHSDVPVGLELWAYGDRGIQQLFVHIDPGKRESVKEYLRDEYAL